MTNVNNPSAFPSHGAMGEVVEQGMTLRDYFAIELAQPLVTALMNSKASADEIKDALRTTVAPVAYGLADEMLKERSK